MALSSGTVAVSSSAATVIVAAANPNANPSGFNSASRSVTVTNLDGAITVYLGAAGVTSAGFPLLHGASVTVPLATADALYGLAASGTPNVAFIAGG